MVGYMARTRSLLPLLVLLSLTVSGLAVGVVPARADATRAVVHHKRRAKRCKRGTVRVRQKGSKRVRCIKPGKRPRGCAPAAGMHELRSVITGLQLRVHHHRHLRHAPRTVGALLSARHVDPNVLERVLTRTKKRLPVALTARRARAADTFAGPTVDGWDTTVDTGAGEGGVTVTATKGNATMSTSYADTVKLDDCPDLQGDLRGSRVLDMTSTSPTRTTDARRSTSRRRRPRSSPGT
jgi:hypothetical protein